MHLFSINKNSSHNYPNNLETVFRDENYLTARQGGISTVILASRMTGNPQISGEISGQNYALFMSPVGLNAMNCS